MSRMMSDWVQFCALMTCRCALILLPVCCAFATENASTSASEPRKTGTFINWSGESTENVHDNCPGFLEPIAERGIRGGFTQQCEAILDQMYLDEILPWVPVYAKDNTLTWRYVFDDPLAKRRMVLDTLGDPACMTSGKLLSGDELVDRCNANVIADYAALKYTCTGGLPRIHRFIESGFEVPRYLSVYDRIFDNDSYWEKRWRLEYAFYRHAWIAAKCGGVPIEALASLGVFEDAVDLGGSPAPGQENWWWAEQAFEAHKLMGIADRMSSNLVQTEYGYERKSLSSWQLLDPVMAELLKVKEPGDFQSIAEKRSVRLKHFIAASTWIEMNQANVDQDWLLGQLGEFSDEELRNAADEATAMMAKQGVGETWF